MERGIALDDGFVNLGPAGHVVGFDGQHFLQSIGGAVGLQGPDLHLPKTLAPELGLSAQRLLRHQTVRPNGPRVDFIIHQMVQFQHVHIPNRHGTIEPFPRAPIVQHHLTGPVQAGFFQHLNNLGLFCTIKNRCGHGHTLFQVVAKFLQVIAVHGVDFALRFGIGVQGFQVRFDLFLPLVLIQRGNHLRHLTAQTA